MPWRAHRLRKKKDIERVFKLGRNFNSQLFKIKICENGLGITRFCFIIPAAIVKKANRRNYLKRRLREAARFYLPNIKNGYDVIIYSKSIPADPKNIKYQAISDDLQKIFLKSGLMSKKNNESV